MVFWFAFSDLIIGSTFIMLLSFMERIKNEASFGCSSLWTKFSNYPFDTWLMSLNSWIAKSSRLIFILNNHIHLIQKFLSSFFYTAEKGLEKCMRDCGGKRIVLGYKNNTCDDCDYRRAFTQINCFSRLTQYSLKALQQCRAF